MGAGAGAAAVGVVVAVEEELFFLCRPAPLAAAEGVVDQLLPELPRLWPARNTLVNLSLNEFAEDSRLWRRGSGAEAPITAPGGEEAAGEMPPPASLLEVAAAWAAAMSTEFGGDGGVSCRPGSLGRVAVASVMSGSGSGSGWGLGGPEDGESEWWWSGLSLR